MPPRDSRNSTGSGGGDIKRDGLEKDKQEGCERGDKREPRETDWLMAGQCDGS